MNNHPPKFWTNLFQWFCNDSFFEELQGDLEERFSINAKEKGLRRAKLIYTKEVIKMVRPSVVGKVKSQNLNNIAMFRNYSIVAFRSLIRNRLFSTINIIGLAISMAVGLIAITFVNEIYSYDSFHENGDRIYRVVSDVTRTRGTDYFATTPLITENKLKNNFPGLETLIPVDRGLRGDLVSGDNRYTTMGIHTNANFFNAFTFPLIYGDEQTALENPYSIILTEKTAMRVFGRTDIVGETIQHSRYKEMTITGVAKDPPHNSHIQFDVIGSIATLKTTNSSLLTRWGQSTASYLYIMLPENQATENIQRNLDLLADQENAKVENLSLKLSLQPINDIFPGDGRFNQFGTVMPRENVNSIIILALIVILSACFNYTNLSMARTLKRAKEVGVRKVVGASKSQLILQFIIEAIFVSIFALIIASVLFTLIRPQFLSLNLYIERTVTLLLNTKTYLLFLVFAIITGAISGFLPAIVLSKLKPITVIKGISSIKTSQGIDFRKVLTALQFTLSMGFFILVTLTYKQYRYAINFDLGYDTESVLNVDVQGNDIELLKNQFARIPEVGGISSASMIASTGSYQSFSVKHDNPLDSVLINAINVSAGYIENMNHELISGVSFSENTPADKLVVNELTLKAFGIPSQEAVGQVLSFARKKWEIIGVVKTFHDRSMDKPLAPFMFTSGLNQHYHINLKLETDDILGSMTKLSDAWSTVDKHHEFTARFYSENIERTYSDISASIKTYGLLAAIAISISILGLFGMAVYTTESKTKELAIRKVLGAKLSNLLLLLSKNFLLIFVISAAIAIPAAYTMFNKTVVPDEVYKINIGFWELSGGAIIIILIAFLTISSQTLKAARSNPANSLRDE